MTRSEFGGNFTGLRFQRPWRMFCIVLDMLNRGSTLESIVYELRPYGFLVIAFVALSHSSGSTIGILSSILLMVGSSIIIHARLKFRGLLAGR